MFQQMTGVVIGSTIRATHDTFQPALAHRLRCGTWQHVVSQATLEMLTTLACLLACWRSRQVGVVASLALRLAAEHAAAASVCDEPCRTEAGSRGTGIRVTRSTACSLTFDLH